MARKTKRTERLNTLKGRIDSLFVQLYRGGAEETSLETRDFLELWRLGKNALYHYNVFGHLDLNYQSATYEKGEGRVDFNIRKWLKERVREHNGENISPLMAASED